MREQQRGRQAQHGRQRREYSTSSLPGPDEITQIINGDVVKLVNVAEELGPYLKNHRLTTSQIRNIFVPIKNMEMEMEMKEFNPKELILLKPKLAYIAGKRDASEGTKSLVKVLTQAIDNVGNDASKFKYFVDFFEAILAYHRRGE